MSTPNPQQETELRNYDNYIIWQIVALLNALKVQQLTSLQDKAVESKSQLIAATIRKDFQSELTKYAKAVDDEVVGKDFNISKIPFGPAQIEAVVVNRHKDEQRQAHAAIRERFGIGK